MGRKAKSNTEPKPARAKGVSLKALRAALIAEVGEEGYLEIARKNGWPLGRIARPSRKVTLDEVTARELAARANETGIPRDQVVIDALTHWLAKTGAQCEEIRAKFPAA